MPSDYETILTVVIAFLIYFLPSTIAFHRRVPNKWAILILNFTLGWTGVAWVAALVWSLTNSSRKQLQQPTIIINQVQGDQTTTKTKEKTNRNELEGSLRD